MDQKWIWILVILVFCQKITSVDSRDVPVKEGKSVIINCELQDKGSMVVWLRILDTSGMEFIASFSITGVLKQSGPSFDSIFSYQTNKPGTLTLQSFNKNRDSGVYSCGVLKNSALIFGPTTRLYADTVPVEPTKSVVVATKESLCTTAKPCVCTNNMKPAPTNPELFCDPIILGPLAGGCGLLLLILIIITLYCNKIRTRRCPHHYKRKPRTDAPGKQMMNKRHV
ncbi:T-cell surface glycoprotein CD8 alpha chain [Centropristis striata]|uniref:T-cell surface glycoprotein CD8 alpha chain n=1 Tax=Centropristis striata TaxID=184440 RepID=UPI0027E1A44B|nr:T-cell surface glycoprotein CD8 alpha chain [Centropristis striata]